MYFLKTLKTKISKSTVMFKGDYNDELMKTMEFIQETLEKELVESLHIDSIDIGRNNMKIRINDDERKIFKIINCVFRHDNHDKKFGFCHIEFALNEISKKPRVHYVGKFGILEKEKITEKISKDLVYCIEVIY